MDEKKFRVLTLLFDGEKYSSSKTMLFELLSHPPYSSDLAPRDYWLLADLQRMLQGKSYTRAFGDGPRNLEPRALLGGYRDK
ncbi:hypothetical protein TNCV_1628401 [Trichonephila clavipes]|nr:hypothetical protein TNCV_1628401 [Trichonephila clavipes]